MRLRALTLLGATGVVLAAGCVPPHPNDAYMSTAPNPREDAKKQACLGQSLDTCLKHIFTTINLETVNLSDQIRRNSQPDEPGHKLSDARFLTFSGTLNSMVDRDRETEIRMEYSISDFLVTGLRVSMEVDPWAARTFDDYAVTGLYESLVLMLGSDCPNLTSFDTFKFFENEVKPKMKIDIQDAKSKHPVTEMDAPDIPFCGRKFSYHHSSTTLPGYRDPAKAYYSDVAISLTP